MINYALEKILHSYPKSLTIICHKPCIARRSNLMVSVSKFGIDTTKNPWYRVDLKKLVSPIPSLRKVGFRKSLISSTVAPEKT